ncbi:MAG: hypothetical protein V1904_07780, partial [Bacteroidota bacterium]
AKAQVINYNLLFKKDQTQLTANQEKEIDSLAMLIKNGERLVVYPLTYDSIFDCLTFAKNAKVQASEIAKYSITIGFELLGTPMNFPSTYKGLSVSVNMKYHKPKDTITSVIDPDTLANTLKNHYPPKASQYFIIDPDRDTLIVGNEGTKLLFEAGSLISPKKVIVELKEFYTLEDYIKNDIPTISNGKMIITGGAIYLNAVQKDSAKQQVKINSSKGVGVEFSLGKDDTTMQIFIKDPLSPKKINWILAPPVNAEDWQMTETLLDYDGSIISKKTYYSKADWEKHLKEVNEARINEIKKEIEKEGPVDFYNIMKIYNFGYINCDAFYTEPMSPYIIAADEKITAEYYLVYQSIRGLMKGEVNNNLVTFGKVPLNLQATLLAVSFIDKQPYFFKSTFNVGSAEKQKIILAPVDESYLNEQLKLLK